MNKKEDKKLQSITVPYILGNTWVYFNLKRSVLV